MKGGARIATSLWMAAFLSVSAASPQTVAVEPDHADLVYAWLGGAPLEMDLYLPAGATQPVPVVMYIHGGGWLGGDKYPLHPRAQGLLDHGFAVASVNYRLTNQVGAFGGEGVIFPAQIHDVKGAIRWLRANGGDYCIETTRIGLWGASAGGHLAALAGTSADVLELEGDVGGNLGQSSRVQAIADYFGPTDILFMNLDRTWPPGGIDHDLPESAESRLMGWDQPGQGIGDIRVNMGNPNPPYPELVDRCLLADPIQHVTPDDPPFLIAHGTEDTQVPLAQSTKLKNELDAAQVSAQYIEVVGAEHGDLGPDTIDAVIDFFIQTLEPDVTPPSLPVIENITALSDEQIELTWSESVDPETGVSGYRIHRDGDYIATVPAPELTFTDEGLEELTAYTYQVAAANGHGYVGELSDPAQTTTLADTTPPSVVKVSAVTDPNAVTIVFSEPVDALTAEDPANFAINRGIIVQSASLAVDEVTVTLTTTALSSMGYYDLTVQKVRDLAQSPNLVGPGVLHPFFYNARTFDGIIAYYDFAEQQGTTVHDVSGAGDAADLTIGDPNAVEWIFSGLRITSPTVIDTALPPEKILAACTISNELTIEAWVAPADTSQTGPARIVTLSANPSLRNFTLGQAATKFDARIRTTGTDDNGLPSMQTPSGSATTNLMHVVCTRSAAGERYFYLDGIEAASGTLGGDFSNWNGNYRFALANELTGDRPWTGDIYLVAVYDRALTAAEVAQNFSAGAVQPNAMITITGDINGDGSVNLIDLLLLLAAWGDCPPGSCPADINADGVVNVRDLLELLANWG